MKDVNVYTIKKIKNFTRIRYLRDKYRETIKDLYKENELFKIIIAIKI